MKPLDDVRKYSCYANSGRLLVDGFIIRLECAIRMYDGCDDRALYRRRDNCRLPQIGGRPALCTLPPNPDSLNQV